LSNRESLLQKGIRVDRVKRIYTVINIPEELFVDDAYGLKTNDINRVSRTYLTEALRDMRQILNSIGLNELYESYETKKVDKYSYLVIIGYKFLNTKKIANFFWYVIVPILTISLTTLLFYIIKN
jgi:hypothetical protein